MKRVFITLPDSLHQRLKFAARIEGKSMAQMIRELLEKALAMRENAQIAHVHHPLDQVRGIANAADPAVSSTINETLYDKT